MSLFWSTLFVLALSPLLEASVHPVLRVMSFNTWRSGMFVRNGLDKIAKHILAVDPDIVGLQELQSSSDAQLLLSLLNANNSAPRQWKSVSAPDDLYPDTVVLTQHNPIPDRMGSLHFYRTLAEFVLVEDTFDPNYAKTTFATGTSIQVDLAEGNRTTVVVNLFNVHFEHRNDPMLSTRHKLVTRPEQLMAAEGRDPSGHDRVHNLEQLFSDGLFRTFKNEATPFIVLGDFNAPSHLDWTEENKDLHGDWAFEWPVTKMMADVGFVDTFRQLHNDSRAEPGITWSTVRKYFLNWDWNTIPEPQDRIDFVFARASNSPQLRAIRSYTYAGHEELKPVPKHTQNDWPSDHFALVTEFEIDWTE